MSWGLLPAAQVCLASCRAALYNESNCNDGSVENLTDFSQVNADWTEIAVTIRAEDTDRAGAIAQMVVPYGIYIEDYSHLEEEAMEIAHIDLIDEALLQKDRTKSVIHVYISPEDWINNWKKYFKPIPVGERLLVRPIWEDEYDAGGRAVLHLEPGLAFGTGTHETTRLCMELLEKYVKPGDEMLDMGCGSGILSVAGLLLGAGRAVGVDIDPLAVKTAVANAEVNGVADRFTGICGNLAEKVSGTFDIVAANIVADVVILLTRDAPRFMKPDTVYILSGIIDTREDDVLACLSDRFELIDRREEKGWVALAAKLR